MSLLEAIQGEFARRLREESYDRIAKCVSFLSDDQLWMRPNEKLVSVANLILHLNGNVKQWILTGIGDREDLRQRDKEFNLTERISKKELLEMLGTTIDEAIEVVDKIDESQLSNIKSVQGFQESVISIIIHVIEHFSYHTGQITYFTKYIKDIDTNYYGDKNLNATT